ncbi:restriction endonuclease subunit S [Deinococcus piscis]|nr:restriction endonuclease subunit S [Deinococcus piscis]
MAEEGKQKAGGVPEGWREVPIDAVAKRGSGHTPNKGNPDYWNGGIKWVSLADSSKLDNRYITETDKEISLLGIKNSSAVLLTKGTVVLSRDAGVGKSAILAEEMAVSQHFMTWTADEKNTHNIFLYYWLQNKKPEFEAIATGSTIKTIGLPYFKKLNILLPPLPEQRKIAAILSTWDDSLATLTDLIAAKRQQKRGLAEALLTGQKRLPGFEGEWEETRFSSVMQESRISAPDELGKRLTVSLHLKGVSVREERDSSEAGKTIYYRRKTGQFIYGKQNIFRGSLGLVPQELDGYLSSQDLPAFDIAPEYDPAFVFAFFARPKFYEELEKIATGTGSKRVHPEAIYRLSHPLPPLPEQQAIASVLSTLDSEIASLESLKAKVQEQKRGLMDELLTGRVRVKVDE